MVTIKDIAKRLGVAVSTVSKGLNGASDISEETRQTILSTAVEMGYAARKIQKSGSNKMCVLLDNMDYTSIGSFGYELVMGFRLAATQCRGLVDILLYDGGRDFKEDFDSFMLRKNYCGAFLAGFTMKSVTRQQLERTTFPAVLLDHMVDNPRVGCMGSDYEQAFQETIGYLMRLGHDKIAFFNDKAGSVAAVEKEAAFRRTMETFGLPVEEGFVERGSFEAERTKDIAASLVSKGVTAVMCSSDLVAAQAVEELGGLGLRVPQEVSVVGFDDLPIAQAVSPALTTVRQDRIALGKAAYLMLEGLKNEIELKKILLRPRLVIRESTAPRME